MKKIILTEKQIEKLKTKINESAVGNERYGRDINVSIGVNYEQRFKGMEINDVQPYDNKINVTYLIEQEHRSWGIKNISLYDIKGPSEINATISFYNENDEEFSEDITIPLNWENLDTDTREGHGVITVGNDLDISLYIDQEGNFSTELGMEIYTL